MDDIAEIRAFNRFYVRRIGLFDDVVPGDMSLTEARLIYEIGSDARARARGLAARLGLDEGYVSRSLKRLEGLGLITRAPLPEDGRVKCLGLTAAGRARHDRIVARAEAAVARMLGDMDGPTRGLLIEAMATIEGVLGAPEPGGVALHEMGKGDIGWLVKRHGELYAEAEGFDLTFEALVARIAGGVFEDGARPGNTGWVAVRRRARLGAVLFTAESAEVGRLRTLIVEPWARGMGVGQRLVERVIAHAQAAGFRRLVLWTQAGLGPAVRLYGRAGFRMIEETPGEAFGQRVVNQTWALELTGGDAPRPG